MDGNRFVRHGLQRTEQRTCEGPDVFSGASLSDGTRIKDRSHGVGGKGESDKRDVKLRLYRFGKETGDGGDLGSRTGAGLPSLEFN